MKATDFKNKVKEVKDFLKNKEIILSLMTKDGLQKFTFKSLREFGNKVLELEKLGAGFAFSKVGNPLTECRAITQAELNNAIATGVWTKVFIHSSIL